LRANHYRWDGAEGPQGHAVSLAVGPCPADLTQNNGSEQ